MALVQVPLSQHLAFPPLPGAPVPGLPRGGWGVGDIDARAQGLYIYIYIHTHSSCV